MLYAYSNNLIQLLVITVPNFAAFLDLSG